MKVIQINAVPNGSTGRLAMELHKEAEKKDIESLFIYTTGHAEEMGTICIGSSYDQKLHTFLSRLTGLQGYWSKGQTQDIIKRIETFNPDVVHLHNIHANSVNFNMLLKYLAKKHIAVCITLHDCFFFTGHCCYYTDVNCQKWQKQCGKCPQMKKYNKSWFFDTSSRVLKDKKNLFENIDLLAVVGVSKWISAEAKKSILSGAYINDYVYNWVDQTIFYPREVAKPNKVKGKFIILGVSQGWSKYKGLDDFISLSKRLKDDEIIILVGSCLKKLPTNIIHIERTNDANELASLYSAADVFVTPSKQETFGLVTAEALSCGTPVVVYDNTASPELVGHRCGYVCENENVEDMLEAIRKIKQVGKMHYSEHCVSFAKEKFNLSGNIESYYKIYRRLTGRMNDD